MISPLHPVVLLLHRVPKLKRQVVDHRTPAAAKGIPTGITSPTAIAPLVANTLPSLEFTVATPTAQDARPVSRCHELDPNDLGSWTRFRCRLPYHLFFLDRPFFLDSRCGIHLVSCKYASRTLRCLALLAFWLCAASELPWLYIYSWTVTSRVLLHPARISPGLDLDFTKNGLCRAYPWTFYDCIYGWAYDFCYSINLFFSASITCYHVFMARNPGTEKDVLS